MLKSSAKNKISAKIVLLQKLTNGPDKSCSGGDKTRSARPDESCSVGASEHRNTLQGSLFQKHRNTILGINEDKEAKHHYKLLKGFK